MRTRLGGLRAIGPPPDGLIGHWSAIGGSVTIRAAASGALAVTMETSSWPNAAWTCEVESEARAADGVVTLDGGDGWTVTIRRDGPALLVEESGPAASGDRPYCGRNGAVDGYYFAARPR